jgi:nicotinamidase-related amidase
MSAFKIDLDSICNRDYRVMTKIDPRKTILLVIDMQRFFLEPGQPAYLPGGDGAPSGEEVIAPSRVVIDRCRAAGITVMYSKWGLRGDGWDVGRWADKWPTWKAGTPEGPSWPPEGAETSGRLRNYSYATDIVRELDPAEGELVFAKSRYSSFDGTILDTALRERPEVDTLIMIGVTTGFCVRYTANDAFARNYRLAVIADCTSAVNDPLFAQAGSGQYVAALRDIATGLGDVMTSEELFQLL